MKESDSYIPAFPHLIKTLGGLGRQGAGGGNAHFSIFWLRPEFVNLRFLFLHILWEYILDFTNKMKKEDDDDDETVCNVQ